MTSESYSTGGLLISEKGISSRSNASKVAIGIGAFLVVAGCPAFLGALGPTPEEQKQIRQLRGMQQAVSQVENVDLKYAFGAISEVLSLGVPTFYGTDLAPYLVVLPWPKLPTPNKNVDKIPFQNNYQDPDGEIGQVLSKDRRQQLTLQFNGGNSTVLPDVKGLNYQINLGQGLQGVTGSLKVTTTSRSAFKRKDPPAAGQPYRFGRNFLTNQPSGIQLVLALQRGSQQLADARINLRQGTSGTITPLLPEISVSGSLSKTSFNLEGRVSSSGIRFSNGDLTIVDAQSVRQELQVTELAFTARSFRLVAEGVTQRYRIELELSEEQLSGVVTSTNPELSRDLAKITPKSGGTEIKYIDRPQAEPWR